MFYSEGYSVSIDYNKKTNTYKGELIKLYPDKEDPDVGSFKIIDTTSSQPSKEEVWKEAETLLEAHKLIQP